MSLSLSTRAVALAACGVLAVPSVAAARGGDHGGDRESFRGGNDDVPARVAAPLKRATKALDRAADRIDDGESGAAALTSVRSNLQRALKATQKRLSGDSGEASAARLAGVDHRVVSELASLYDGQSGDTVDALNATLDAALDNRDALVAGIAALDSDARAEYDLVLESIAEDAGDETDELEETVSDDELTGAAESAIDAALAQLAATRSAAESAVVANSFDDEEGFDDVADRDDRDGRHHRGGRPCPKRDRGGEAPQSV